MARACCEYMKAHFHPTNCLAVRTFAESHNRVDLMDMADRYACEHFTEVVECEDFICMSPQHLHTLLSSNELNIHSETQVYNAAVKWLKANPQHHEAWLDQIMSQVREPAINPSQQRARLMELIHTHTHMNAIDWKLLATKPCVKTSVIYMFTAVL